MDVDRQLCDVSSLLLQKWPAPEFEITTCLHLEGLVEGDVAGMVSLGGCYTALAVKRQAGGFSLQQRTGNWTMADEVREELEGWQQERIWLRMRVERSEDISFAVSADGEKYRSVGRTTKATPGRWVGVKAGLFVLNETGVHGGSVAADFFVYTKLEEK